MAARLRFLKRIGPDPEVVENIEVARTVVRVQAGERAAFVELYERYFERIANYAQVTLRDPHEAEDVAQEVFIRAFEAVPRYELRGTPFGVWLFRIARNQAINRLAKLGRDELEEPNHVDQRVEIREAAAGADIGVLNRLSDQEMMLFIERMPLAQRQVVMLRYMFDMSIAEVAHVMGRSPNAVRQLQSRAFGFLRKRFSAIGREPRQYAPRSPVRRIPRNAWVVRTRKFALRP